MTGEPQGNPLLRDGPRAAVVVFDYALGRPIAWDVFTPVEAGDDVYAAAAARAEAAALAFPPGRYEIAVFANEKAIETHAVLDAAHTYAVRNRRGGYEAVEVPSPAPSFQAEAWALDRREPQP